MHSGVAVLHGMPAEGRHIKPARGLLQREGLAGAVGHFGFYDDASAEGYEYHFGTKMCVSAAHDAFGREISPKCALYGKRYMLLAFGDANKADGTFADGAEIYNMRFFHAVLGGIVAKLHNFAKIWAMKNVERQAYAAFGALMLLLLAYYAGSGILHSPPAHIHAWTQSDRWALAWGYADEGGGNFFLPRTYNLATIDGVTGVDFPLHEYIIGWLMWLLGTREAWVFRLYMLSLVGLGNLYLFRLVWACTRSVLAALLLVGWVSTLPILLYYQAGFLPSVSAWSSLWVGNFYFLRYWEEGQRKDGRRAIFFLALAALVRLPFVLYAAVAAILLVFRWWRQRNWDRHLMFFGAGAAAFVGAWLWYKGYLGRTYGTQFLTQLMPPRSWVEFVALWEQIRERWQGQIMGRGQYVFVGLLFGVSLLRCRWGLGWGLLLLSLGAAVFYFLLMMRQFVDHEYYFIDSLFVPLVWLLILGARATLNADVHWIWRWVWGLLWLLLLGGSLPNSLAVQAKKNAFALWDGGEATRLNFLGAGDWLDSAGVSPSARILVIDAYSTNAPLLALRRKGWTLLNTRDTTIEKALTLPFDFIVLQDQFTPPDGYARFSPRFRRLGGNGKISLYALREPASGGDVFAFLGLDTAACLRQELQGGRLSGEFSPALELRAKPLRRVLLRTQIKQSADLQFVAHLSDTSSGKVLYYWEHRVPQSDTLRPFHCVFSLPEGGASGSRLLRLYLWRRDAGAAQYEKIELFGD